MKLNMKYTILETDRLVICNSRTKWPLCPQELSEHHTVVDLGSSHARTTRYAFFGFIEIIDLDSRVEDSEQ